MPLKECLNRADAAVRAAWDAIEGPITIKDSRSQLFLAYASIALEHQEAIVLLVRSGLRGAAFALIRPVFEIFYRAAWIHYCAKPNEIDKIKLGQFDFPGMGTMVTQIDTAIGGTFFQDFKANRWKSQNDFTHTGRMQVYSRLTREDLQAVYPDEMVAVNLDATTMVAVLVVVLLLKTHDRVADGERLERLLAQFSAPQVRYDAGMAEAPTASHDTVTVKEFAEITRQMIRHEETVLTQRLSWCVTIEGLLLAALGFAWEKAPPEYVLSFAGICVSLSTVYASIVTVDTMIRLTDHWEARCKQGIDYNGPGVVGRRPDQWSSTFRPSRFIPGIFCFVWMMIIMIRWWSSAKP